MMSRQFDPEQFVLMGEMRLSLQTPTGPSFYGTAERVFGYTESKALSHSLDLIIPARKSKRVFRFAASSAVRIRLIIE